MFILKYCENEWKYNKNWIFYLKVTKNSSLFFEINLFTHLKKKLKLNGILSEATKVNISILINEPSTTRTRNNYYCRNNALNHRIIILYASLWLKFHWQQDEIYLVISWVNEEIILQIYYRSKFGRIYLITNDWKKDCGASNNSVCIFTGSIIF